MARNRKPKNKVSMFLSSTDDVEVDIDFAGHVIETTVADNAIRVENWIREIRGTYRKPFIVGLDCEWKPNRFKNQSNPVALLQLCIDKKCLIIQLLHMDRIPRLLKGLLHDSSITFVGVGVDDDATKLRNDYGLKCFRTVDIREMAMESEYALGFQVPTPGLKQLALEIVGLPMHKPKRVTMSNWESCFLTEDQIEYACIDAYVSYRIGHKLFHPET